MKTIFSIVLFTLLLVGCEETRPVQVKDGATVVVIDSCEYIRNSVYSGRYVMIHKGNCKFCAERKKQEIDKLIDQLKQ